MFITTTDVAPWVQADAADLDDDPLALKILDRACLLVNETAWGTAQWLRLAEMNGWPRTASVQNEYSLLCRHFDTDVAELCHHEGVTLLAYAIHRRDPVFMFGQALGLLIYIRNLWLIRASNAAQR